MASPDTLLLYWIGRLLDWAPQTGALVAILGTLGYGYGKAANQPGWVRYGWNCWGGAAVLWGSVPCYWIARAVTTRVVGSGFLP